MNVMPRWRSCSQFKGAHAIRMIFASYSHLEETCGGTLGMVLGLWHELVVEAAIDALDDDSEEVCSGAVASLRLLVGIPSVRAHMKMVLTGMKSLTSAMPRNRRCAGITSMCESVESREVA